MSREERHTSPGFDTGPVREGSEEKTGSEMARGWPKVTQQVWASLVVRMIKNCRRPEFNPTVEKFPWRRE